MSQLLLAAPPPSAPHPINVVFCTDIVHSLGAAVASFFSLLTFILEWQKQTGCLNPVLHEKLERTSRFATPKSLAEQGGGEAAILTSSSGGDSSTAASRGTGTSSSSTSVDYRSGKNDAGDFSTSASTSVAGSSSSTKGAGKGSAAHTSSSNFEDDEDAFADAQHLHQEQELQQQACNVYIKVNSPLSDANGTDWGLWGHNSPLEGYHHLPARERRKLPHARWSDLLDLERLQRGLGIRILEYDEDILVPAHTGQPPHTTFTKVHCEKPTESELVAAPEGTSFDKRTVLLEGNLARMRSDTSRALWQELIRLDVERRKSDDGADVVSADESIEALSLEQIRRLISNSVSSTGRLDEDGGTEEARVEGRVGETPKETKSKEPAPGEKEDQDIQDEALSTTSISIPTLARGAEGVQLNASFIQEANKREFRDILPPNQELELHGHASLWQLRFSRTNARVLSGGDRVAAFDDIETHLQNLKTAFFAFKSDVLQRRLTQEVNRDIMLLRTKRRERIRSSIVPGVAAQQDGLVSNAGTGMWSRRRSIFDRGIFRIYLKDFCTWSASAHPSLTLTASRALYWQSALQVGRFVHFRPQLQPPMKYRTTSSPVAQVDVEIGDGSASGTNGNNKKPAGGTRTNGNNNIPTGEVAPELQSVSVEGLSSSEANPPRPKVPIKAKDRNAHAAEHVPPSFVEVRNAEMTRYSDNTLKHREEFERYREKRSVKKWQQVKGTSSQVERVFAKSGITFNNGVAGGVVGENNKLDVDEPTTRELNKSQAQVKADSTSSGTTTTSKRAISSPISISSDSPEDAWRPLYSPKVIKSVSQCAYWFLRRKLEVNVEAFDAVHEIIHNPAFVGRHRQADHFISLKHADLDLLFKAAVDVQGILFNKPIRRKFSRYPGQLMWVTSTFMSFTSCLHSSMGNGNAYRTQECKQIVNLAAVAKEVAELARSEGLDCVNLNMNMFVDSGHGRLVGYTESELVELEEFMEMAALYYDADLLRHFDRVMHRELVARKIRLAFVRRFNLSETELERREHSEETLNYRTYVGGFHFSFRGRERGYLQEAILPRVEAVDQLMGDKDTEVGWEDEDYVANTSSRPKHVKKLRTTSNADSAPGQHEVDAEDVDAQKNETSNTSTLVAGEAPATTTAVMNAYADGGTPLDYILATRRGYLETRLKYLLEENTNWCWSDLAYRIETLEQDKRATKTERQERRMELEGLRNARRIHSEGVAEATRIYNGRVHKQRKDKCRTYFAKRRRKRLWRELLELESLAGRREDRLRDNDHEDSSIEADQHQSDLLTSDAPTGENFALTLPDFDEDQKMYGDDCGIEWPRDRMLNTRDAMGLPILTPPPCGRLRRRPLVKFHILRKPYANQHHHLTKRYKEPPRDGAPKNSQVGINFALMHLASIAPMLITEVGTYWTDALIMQRLSGCGYFLSIPEKVRNYQARTNQFLRLRETVDLETNKETFSIDEEKDSKGTFQALDSYHHRKGLASRYFFLQNEQQLNSRDVDRSSSSTAPIDLTERMLSERNTVQRETDAAIVASQQIAPGSPFLQHAREPGADDDKIRLKYRRELNQCKPVVILEGNRTDLMKPVFHCGLFETPADFDRCRCALQRGRCSRPGNEYRGYLF